MQNMTAQQLAAHQAIAEIIADLGPAFALSAAADAIEQMSRTEAGQRGDALGYATGLLRQIAEVLK